MEIRELIASPPTLHDAGKDGFVHYGIDLPAIEFIIEHIKPGMVTLETGGGFTTLLLAMLGAEHTCIMPAPDLIRRIEAYASEQAIDLGRVRFIARGSEQALPLLETPPLDLALIDGRHGFPTPAIDWYYLSRHLKPGGWVMIDDVHLWPCRILSDFLRAEPDWRQVDCKCRSIDVFELLRPVEHREWCDQAYVVRRSRWYRFRKRILQHLDRIQAGDFSQIAKLFRNK